MKPSDTRVELINVLINALEEIKNEKPNWEIKKFGKYSREDVLIASHFLLKIGLPRFEDLSEEDFEKLIQSKDKAKSIDEFVEGLREILNSSPLRENVVTEEFVETWQKPEAGTVTTTQKGQDIYPQDFTSRLRRMVNYLESNKVLANNGEVYVETVQKIPETRTSDFYKEQIEGFRDKAENDPGFRDFVTERIRVNNPTERSQEIAAATDTFITALNVGPAFFASVTAFAKNTKLNIPSAKEKDKINFAKICDEFFQKYSKARKPLQEAFGEEIVEALIPEASLVPQEIRITSKPQNMEAAVRINPGEIAKLVEVTPKMDEKSFERFWQKTPTAETINQPIAPEAIPVSGFWTSPVSAPAKIFIKAGVAKYGEDKPAEAASLHLAARYGITQVNLSEFRARAMGMGVTSEQFNILERAFRDIRPDDSTFWMKTALAGKIALLDGPTVQALFAGQTIDYTAVAPRQNFISAAIQRGVMQIAGGPARNVVNRAIANRIANVAGKAVTEGIASKAIAAALNAIPGVGPVLSFLGLVAGPLIKKYIVPIIAGIGALVGFVTFGALGAIGGGIIGAGVGGIAIGAGIGAGITVLMSSIGAILAGLAQMFAVPFVIFIIGISAVVAMIIFIINSSAYVVPPSTGTLIGGGTAGEPAACFKLGGLWSPELAKNMVDATQKVAAQKKYIERLCAAGNITLFYRPDAVEFGGLTLPPSTIWIGELGAKNVASAFYTLAHESGHILASRTTFFQVYVDDSARLETELDQNGPKKGIICTYPINDGDPYWGDMPTSILFRKRSENFAEMMALYFTSGDARTGTRTFSCLGGGGFKGQYPLHWDFANARIFN